MVAIVSEAPLEVDSYEIVQGTLLLSDLPRKVRCQLVAWSVLLTPIYSDYERPSAMFFFLSHGQRLKRAFASTLRKTAASSGATPQRRPARALPLFQFPAERNFAVRLND